ncbi:capsular biosynthesis protein [Mesobacillus campisalis]|uniref:Capsular biosynthesis protein n=1 Tax=Mesobacillus campisalis TaxID=1408103 RepID=A0A0M2SYC6_9BACI|nr:Wzz/FepE/Etk N-terminal domain-containing protein [Mesobacillus campisalis]KKK38711.1 capsular biosynthesis protein [Mesobacillus campisalis]
MEETISLKELLSTLKKRWALIIAIAIAAVTISGVVSYFFLTPIYQASTQILVNQEKNEQMNYSTTEVQTNLQLINTYNVIIKSPAILDLVINELNLNMTAQQLSERIAVGSEKDSQVVNLSVQNESAETAAQIANTTASVFQREISNIMNVNNVSILAEASVLEGQAPVKPTPILNIMVALVVGLMLGTGLAFLLDYFDNTVKSEQDAEKLLELPVLGIISVIDDSEMEKMKAKRTSKNLRTRGETVGF